LTWPIERRRNVYKGGNELNICLCDDNKEDLLHLTQIIEEFKTFHLSEYDLKYTTFSNGIDLLTEIEKGKYFDIFLLDVVMIGMNGVELANEIRNKNAVSKIIFLTTSPEYALESYEVNAFYYLLKPIEKVKLINLLEKACAGIFDQREKYIIVKSQTSLTKIYLHCIQYVDVMGRNIFFHLKSGEIIKSLCSISQIESELLTDKRFIKTHRSYIVNMDYIKNIAPKGIATFSNTIIPIARTAYKEIKQKYIDYSFDSGE
jgi:DNA-binding LytR/AlgR family response regulator